MHDSESITARYACWFHAWCWLVISWWSPHSVHHAKNAAAFGSALYLAFAWQIICIVGRSVPHTLSKWQVVSDCKVYIWMCTIHKSLCMQPNQAAGRVWNDHWYQWVWWELAEGGRPKVHHAQVLLQPPWLCCQQELLCLLPERYEFQDGKPVSRQYCHMHVKPSVCS